MNQASCLLPVIVACARWQQLILPDSRIKTCERILLNMSSPIKLVCLMLLLTAGCFAQDEFVVENKHNQKWPAAEARKIYASSCAAVQQEFGAKQAPKPQLTLILGADRNSVSFDRREISLTKWNPYLFAEGVIMLAFEDRLSYEQRILLTKRALNWAESTVDIGDMKK